MVFIVVFLHTRSNAQLPCQDVTTACIEHPSEPETYICLEGWVYLSYLIDPSNQVLLSQQDAETNAQRIVIKGTLVVDISIVSGGYTFFENSEIVFADPEGGNFSKIIINPGCKLVLNKVSVHGCTRMWDEIEATTSSTLIVKNNCRFKDGFTALKIRGKSTVSITDSYFDANAISMAFWNEGNSNTFPIYFPDGGGVWGNTIDGSSDLLSPYIGKKPYHGISTIRTRITLGSWSHGANTISNIISNDNGGSFIYVGGIALFTNSIVDIQNFNFFRIRPPNYPGSAAILANTSSLKIIGSGTSNIIEDCDAGLKIYSSNADINKTKFINIDNGIEISSNLNVSFKVANSNFENFLYNGIIANQIAPLSCSNFEVDNCIFEDNSLTELGLYNRRYGIKIATGSPTTGSGFKFNNNKMYSRTRGSTSGFFGFTGFHLTNLYGGNGQSNELYDENAETVSYPQSERVFTGVSMWGCNGVRWFDNDFVGLGPQYVESGFQLFDSPNCKLSCNHLDNLGYGMLFCQLCNTSNIYNNSFNNHSLYGVYLQDKGAVIGGQFKKYNTWGGSAGEAEAYMTFPNYDPFNNAHKFQVEKSLFTIQTADQNTAVWADPRIVGNVMGNDQNWFVGPMGPPSWPPQPSLCPADTVNDPSDPKLDFGEKGIVDGTFMPWKGYDANTWDAAFLLYQRMTEDATLRPEGSPEAAWYASSYNTNLGRLRRVFDGFVSLSSDEPTATAAQLLSDLNAIAVTTTHEQNLKTDLSIFLEQYISNGTSLTPQQTTYLNAIADQCRYEGGIGVVLARLALGQSSQREGDCPEGLGRGQGHDRSRQASVNTVNIAVFPNPVPEQSFNVQLDQSIQDGAMCLVDLQGRVAGAWTFSGDVVDIREANVSPGVYFLEVLEQGHVLSRVKIVFSR